MKGLFQFGSKVLIPESQTFFVSPHCFCFVNICPVVKVCSFVFVCVFCLFVFLPFFKKILQGHVLVSPQTVRRRVEDMSDEEACDLFLTGRFVQRVLERVFGVSSSTLVIQDGKDAGQTIDHVHLHVMPRRPGDFRHNDQIYMEIEQPVRKLRSGEEMEVEARMLRAAIEEQKMFDKGSSSHAF